MALLDINYSNCINNDASKKEYKKIFDKLKLASSNFINDLENIEFISEVYHKEKIVEIIKLSENFKKKFKHFCVIGTGGSSLGAQTLIELLPKIYSNKVSFYYDIDPIIFENI